jgi:hypothetical protein
MKEISKTITALGVLKVGDRVIPKGGTKVAVVTKICKTEHKGSTPEYAIYLDVPREKNPRVLSLQVLKSYMKVCNILN